MISAIGLVPPIGVVPPWIDDVPRAMCDGDFCPKTPERDWDSLDPGPDPNEPIERANRPT